MLDVGPFAVPSHKLPRRRERSPATPAIGKQKLSTFEQMVHSSIRPKTYAAGSILQALGLLGQAAPFGPRQLQGVEDDRSNRRASLDSPPSNHEGNPPADRPKWRSGGTLPIPSIARFLARVAAAMLGSCTTTARKADARLQCEPSVDTGLGGAASCKNLRRWRGRLP
jgi:hypothetical protein